MLGKDRLAGAESSRSLEALGDDIDRLNDKIRPPVRKAPPSKAATATRMGLELISGAAVGGGLGWVLDGWLNTSPVLFILCFFLGCAGGFMTLYRTAQNLGNEVE